MERGFNGEFPRLFIGCKRGLIITLLLFLCVVFVSSSFAGDEVTPAIDKADTAWMLVSTALVMLMTPGLAIFYAGMARKKNVLGTIMHSFFVLALISVQWVLWGYTLSFGGDVGGVIGALEYLGLNGVGGEPKGTIPHLVFMMFQGMFAIITVALITGGFAERIRFSAVVVFSILWATLVYDPLCHWIWGGGWLSQLGTLDFAGGMVVHISCGVSAIVAAIVIGKRRGYPRELMPPHNLTLTVIGMGLLWFGWFGFNAGSALAANDIAAFAFVNTNTAAAMATLTWVFIEWIHRGKPTVLGAVSGAVAGLASITPAAGFVGPGSALLVGLVGGGLCYWAVGILKPRLGYDDTLDVFGIHAVGGTWGSIATGLFASIGAKGLFFGNPYQLVAQFIGIISAVLLSVVGTFIILKLVDVVIKIRVSNEEEIEGLDLSQHGESGYVL
ncbi:MAG: ammonium transporter [Deltaproteobacteria bacterium]|nr:ammonium transporter [Deltaproteobacteria bacterium]